MSNGQQIISLIGQRQDLDQFRRKHWIGTFVEYLDLVRADPKVTRNAFERIFDMILSYGSITLFLTIPTRRDAMPCLVSTNSWNTLSTL